MTDTEQPTNTPPHRSDEDQPCKPLHLDFERIAATVTAKHAERGTPRTLRTVEHAIGHLREETGLGDKQIARVLIAAACLLGELVTEAGPRWNGIVTTNWLSTTGAHLWNHDEQPNP